MADDARQTAHNPAAPADERRDALAQLTRENMPSASDLLPPDVIHAIAESLELVKAAQIIEFPSDRVKRGAAGLQSMHLDESQAAMQGDFYEKPGMQFEQMRRMVDGAPILSAVIMTRQKQVARFCSPSEDGGMGFAIRHVDPTHELEPEEKESITRLTRFIQHCGFEWNPRARKKLKRDSFAQFIQKATRDTLTMDSMPIELEMKRDRSLGIDGFGAIDGETIRLCQDGFEGDPDIVAVQFVNGRLATRYDDDSLIYEPRNPRADVRRGGYGFSETEVLVQTITGFLSAMTLNISGFTKNSIPRGMLHLTGKYDDKDLAAFKRYWKQMVSGADNAFAMPVMVSEDQESKASFEAFGAEFNEMYFSKWMTFLTSMVCAVYGMDPNEICFESFTNGTSSLSGSDTEEKLAASKDKGLRPLMSYLEQTLTDFIITDFSDKYCFRWVGLDEKDAAREWEAKKLILTVDELRAEQGYEKHEDATIGGAPLNPSLITLYQQAQQPQGTDFGGGGGGDFGQPDQDGGPPGQGADEDQDGEQDGDGPPGPPDPAQGGPPAPDAPPGGGGDFGKALAPIFSIGGA